MKVKHVAVKSWTAAGWSFDQDWKDAGEHDHGMRNGKQGASGRGAWRWEESATSSIFLRLVGLS